MSLVINTNVTSNVVQTNLSRANRDVNSSIERLTTGYKINRAADDAAGLAIAQGMTTQANGTLVAQDNTAHGTNLLQTAEGDMDVIQQNLQRVRDLTIQAANGVYSSTEKMMLASEVKARIEEINRIVAISKFSGIQLLDGTASSQLILQVGANWGANNQLNISGALINCTLTVLNSHLTTTEVDNTFKDSNRTNNFIQYIDDAIDQISDARSKIGACQNRLEATADSLEIRYENMASSLSTIQDADIAAESTKLTKAQILQNFSTTLLAQANATPQAALNLIQ